MSSSGIAIVAPYRSQLPMLTGPELGAAIEAARKKKGVTKKAMADHFGVTPPSVQDWVRRGTIDKHRLPELWMYFHEVAPPSHWGLRSWAALQHVSEGVATYTVAQDVSQAAFDTDSQPANQVPVIGTLEMGVEKLLELRTGADGAPIGFIVGGPRMRGAYAVQVFGDDLYPTVRHGNCLVVAPGNPCIEGELVLLELAEGQYLVAELVSQRAESITITPASGTGARRTFMRSAVQAMHPVLYVATAAMFSATTAAAP